ncbi:uncharacterized protein LOC122374916 [Amphibalanus amphitrite]|uniref:uncharacterized protein LOC122374916 n=1 Tax=Amphibalanus amphitrite TaxID=1232801 RepID=UPI001C8FE83F|nr:uncharacterized protein LOC122374916 [Amphibalanus amphitrite]
MTTKKTPTAQSQNTGQKPGKSCTTAPEMEGIRRSMDTPRSLAEMASALGRVLRWREQLLSKSHSRHRAHYYQQLFKDVLHGRHLVLIRYFCGLCGFNNVRDGHWKCGSHACIAIQNIFVSGSVSEGTEVHVTKYKSRVSGTIVEAFEWVSEGGFAMPHWIEGRKERMATGKEESSDNAPSALTFETASDIDFMILTGPVMWHTEPLRDSGSSNSSEKTSRFSESSDREAVGSQTKQHGSAAVENKSNGTGSTGADSSDNTFTLHVEEDTDKPGFVKITQALQWEGDTSVRRELPFYHCKSHIAEAMKGHVESIKNYGGPNIEVTINGDSNDLVPCLQYPERVSDEFVNRERPSGQPSKDLVKKLSEMEIYLVEKDDLFRISFSRLESEVIRSMTKPQRICLVLLKHCAAVAGSELCSYELKTAMMWVCERRAPELWTWDGMLESMMAVFDFLQECAEQRALRCYFYREINLWTGKTFDKGLAVLRLRVLLPRAIQLLLAGLLSSSQAPLMRHLLNIPLDAQQMLWCCWKRRIDDPYPTDPKDQGKINPNDLCSGLYPAAVESRLWSERFLDTFRWESLPARCREPDWFAEHGWDTDSEGEEEDREDKDSEDEEENRKPLPLWTAGLPQTSPVWADRVPQTPSPSVWTGRLPQDQPVWTAGLPHTSPVWTGRLAQPPSPSVWTDRLSQDQPVWTAGLPQTSPVWTDRLAQPPSPSFWTGRPPQDQPVWSVGLPQTSPVWTDRLAQPPSPSVWTGRLPQDQPVWSVGLPQPPSPSVWTGRLPQDQPVWTAGLPQTSPVWADRLPQTPSPSVWTGRLPQDQPVWTAGLPQTSPVWADRLPQTPSPSVWTSRLPQDQPVWTAGLPQTSPVWAGRLPQTISPPVWTDRLSHPPPLWTVGLPQTSPVWPNTPNQARYSGRPDSRRLHQYERSYYHRF